jgi:hypothetical protein
MRADFRLSYQVILIRYGPLLIHFSLTLQLVAWGTFAHHKCLSWLTWWLSDSDHGWGKGQVGVMMVKWTSWGRFLAIRVPIGVKVGSDGQPIVQFPLMGGAMYGQGHTSHRIGYRPCSQVNKVQWPNWGEVDPLKTGPEVRQVTSRILVKVQK